jgi:tetratricopeptide (TPR) repeat protein
MHRRVLLSTLCACAVAAPCGAQIPAALNWVEGAVESADALYFAGQPEAAFERLREHLADHPNDYEALWRVVRSTLILGDAGEGWRVQNSWFDTGMAFGDQAVEARPDGVEGRYWRGAVYGRRALNAVPEYGAELAQVAYDDAQVILALEPAHGGAHNILGKIFFEVMSMSRIERFFGRTFVRGDALRKSSWEAAELHLEAAAEDWPDSILFQYDLGELYRKRGRKDEARAAYARVASMPAVHPSDRSVQEDAERALEELGS